MTRVLLSGARGVVGQPLARRLCEAKVEHKEVSRTALDDGLTWDFQEKASAILIEKLISFSPDTLIHCAPIWLLVMHLELLKRVGVKRLIVFSSSSISGKEDSADNNEQLLVEKLVSAERDLQDFCASHDLALTIFRPSLIYGHKNDQNICHIARFISKCGFFVMAGQGNGLRQPVHADDLVSASMSVIDNPKTYSKVYYLAGGESLTYLAMVKRIFYGLDRKPRILFLPVSLFRIILQLAAKTGRFSYSPDMANRMNQDLDYAITEAHADFGYSPQGFLNEPQRDLPVRTS